MRKLGFLAASMILLATTTFGQDNKAKEEQRLTDAGTVLKEVLNVPEGIPQDLLNKSVCVAVYPSVIKAAFGLGGQYGRGTLVCRSGQDYKGAWGAPAMYALEGGSIGFQLGVQATDFVILVMNQRGAESLLDSKVKLGADASVAAGPKGRDAEAATDVYMRAEMLTYSRSRGAFAGVSLEGSTMRPDDDANERVYGRRISARDIIQGSNVSIPAAGQSLVSALQSASPQNLANPPANTTQTQTAPTTPSANTTPGNPSTSPIAAPAIAPGTTPTSTATPSGKTVPPDPTAPTAGPSSTLP